LFTKDASLIDLFWGPLAAVQGWIYRAAAPDAGVASLFGVIVVSLWALRLSLHLAKRNLGKGEDPRYAAMRDAGGATWPLRSLATVFWLQAGLSWIIALPLAVVANSAGSLGLIGWGGAAIAVFGLVFETVADRQLARFKAQPGVRGRVLDSGLWRYSRHPNYFGDAVFWWGVFVVAVGAGGAWTVLGPIVMTVLLMKISGVPLLEARLEETRPGYREYVRRTSAFVPWWPGADR
jgi:steroid 5-alpha reductase family enzyme